MKVLPHRVNYMISQKKITWLFKDMRFRKMWLCVVGLLQMLCWNPTPFLFFFRWLCYLTPCSHQEVKWNPITIMSEFIGYSFSITLTIKPNLSGTGAKLQVPKTSACSHWMCKECGFCGHYECTFLFCRFKMEVWKFGSKYLFFFKKKRHFPLVLDRELHLRLMHYHSDLLWKSM